jgi:hypothetical protein
MQHGVTKSKFDVTIMWSALTHMRIDQKTNGGESSTLLHENIQEHIMLRDSAYAHASPASLATVTHQLVAAQELLTFINIVADHDFCSFTPLSDLSRLS